MGDQPASTPGEFGELWTCDRTPDMGGMTEIWAANGSLICRVCCGFSSPDHRRMEHIVKCVNACAGLTDVEVESIPSMADGWRRRFARTSKAVEEVFGKGARGDQDG